MEYVLLLQVLVSAVNTKKRWEQTQKLCSSDENGLTFTHLVFERYQLKQFQSRLQKRLTFKAEFR